MRSSANQCELFGSNLFRLRELSLRLKSGLSQELFKQRKSDVVIRFAGHERRVRGPIHTCNGARNQTRFERRQLVNQSETVVLFDHPLHVGWSSCGVCEVQWNISLSEHLSQTRMRRGLQLWISENRDSWSGFMNIDLRVCSERVVGPHAEYQWRLRYL